MAADATSLSDIRFLTVAEVATIMRVSKMTVYRLVHSGELEAIRVGRSFRVPEQAVNQYLRDAFVRCELSAGSHPVPRGGRPDDGGGPQPRYPVALACARPAVRRVCACACP